jgi:rhodanese-related sulfurtransferase
MRKTRKPTIRFLNLIDDASMRVDFIEADEMVRRIGRRELLNMIDVREYREFLNSHIEHCKHISKGVLERDVEFHYPDLTVEIIVYCSDGLRSTLAGDALLNMGYSNIKVLRGGFEAWKQAGGKICLA